MLVSTSIELIITITKIYFVEEMIFPFIYITTNTHGLIIDDVEFSVNPNLASWMPIIENMEINRTCFYESAVTKWK